MSYLTNLTYKSYLIPLEKGTDAVDLAVDAFLLFVGSRAKHFHILRVSSAAADTTVLPSGDIAVCRTRAVCPMSMSRKYSIYYINPWIRFQNIFGSSKPNKYLLRAINTYHKYLNVVRSNILWSCPLIDIKQTTNANTIASLLSSMIFISFDSLTKW